MLQNGLVCKKPASEVQRLCHKENALNFNNKNNKLESDRFSFCRS